MSDEWSHDDEDLPTVWTNDNIYITVYIRDYQPPHVHVSDSDNEVKVDISGDVPVVMKRGRKERISSTKKFDKVALKLVANIWLLVRKFGD